MFSAYRMVQPGATMYVPSAAANGAAAAAAAAAAANAQQSIVYTLPQYQTQWEEGVVLVHPYWQLQQLTAINAMGAGGGGEAGGGGFYQLMGYGDSDHDHDPGEDDEGEQQELKSPGVMDINR